MKKNVLTAIALLALIGAGLAVAQERQTPPQPGQQQPDMGTMLIEGLRSTEGCLGVDAGQFRSGKNAIIAWFEDKQAVARWYHSPIHQRMMMSVFGADGSLREPLAHVQDGVQVMVIASLTHSQEREIESSTLPISQIAIELYSAQPGGAFINGRLAPEGFKVEHMRDYTPKPVETGTGTR